MNKNIGGVISIVVLLFYQSSFCLEDTPASFSLIVVSSDKITNNNWQITVNSQNEIVKIISKLKLFQINEFKNYLEYYDKKSEEFDLKYIYKHLSGKTHNLVICLIQDFTLHQFGVSSFGLGGGYRVSADIKLKIIVVDIEKRLIKNTIVIEEEIDRKNMGYILDSGHQKQSSQTSYINELWQSGYNDSIFKESICYELLKEVYLKIISNISKSVYGKPYGLLAKIRMRSGNVISINKGSVDGLFQNCELNIYPNIDNKNAVFDVLSDTEWYPIGKIIITSTEDKKSKAKIISEDSPAKEDDFVFCIK